MYFSRALVDPGVVSGETTRDGRITDEAKVTIEKITRDKEPRRPISPRVSDDAGDLAGSFGAS